MGHSGGIINTNNGGVKMLADVKVVLGETSNHLDDLCKSNAINKWSKRKPVRADVISSPNMALYNYGLSIPAAGYSSLPALLSALDGGYDWEYLRPRGSSYGEWYRLGDFNDYYHDAVSPISFLQNTQITVYEDATTADVVIAFNKVPAGGRNISLYDLKPTSQGITFGSMYFGVLLYNSTTGKYFAATQSSTFSQVAGSSEVSVTVEGVAAPNAGTRTYRAVPFFSTLAITQTITESSTFLGTLFPVPGVECAATITKIAVQTMTYVFGFTYPNQTNPLYWRLNINTSVNLYGAQYQIIASKTSDPAGAFDDVTLVSGTVQTSGTGNIYIPGATTWNSVNNIGTTPVVTEENGYLYIRCALRRGELSVGTHSVLAIAWEQGSSPFDD